MHENAFAGLQTREIEGERRRNERARDRRERGCRDPPGRGRDQLLVRDHVRPERAESHSDHVIADGDVGDLGAGLDDAPAHLPAQQSLFDEPERPEDVPEVQSGCLDLDANLSRREGARGQLMHVRPVEHAVGVGGEHPPRLVGKGQPRRTVPGPHQARHHAAAATVRDVVLRVGVHQLVREVRRGSRRGGVEIEHPGLEVRGLALHALSEAPQGRARQAAAALALQHLRAACHEPQATFGSGARVADALNHGQGALARPSHVPPHLLGRGLFSGAVQGREMHHSAEGNAGGQAVDERPPRLAPPHLDHGGRRVRRDRVRPPGVRFLGARQHHRLVAGSQVAGQPRRPRRRETARAARDHPRARRLGHPRRSLRHDHALVVHGVGLVLVRAQHLHSLETGVAQRLPPYRGARERVAGAVVVGEPPPPVELSEGQVHPAQAAEVLQRDQLSGGREEAAAVVQRLVQGARRVQDVGGDEEVVAVQVEALPDRVLLDVERPVVDASAAVAEARFGLREEAGGDVGVHVLELAVREHREDGGGRRSGARADLDHAQAPSPGQSVDQGADRHFQHAVSGPRNRSLEVEVRRGGLAAAEEESQRIFPAAEDLGQSGRGSPEQPGLRLAVGVPPEHDGGMPVQVGGQMRGPRVPGTQLDDEVAVLFLAERARPGRHLQDSREEAAVFGKDAELFPQLFRIHYRARNAFPAQPVQGLERVGPRPLFQVSEQGVPVVPVDPRLGQVLRPGLRPGPHRRRIRKEVRGRHAVGKRAFPPYDLVEEIADPFARRQQRGAGRPLHRVPADDPEQQPVGIADAHLAGQNFGRLARPRFGLAGRLAHAHVAEHPLRQLPGR